ncbi:MAG: RDD family protein [Candidatus Nanopelagicales bacterium]|jgi:uncharacterized RDD family membrane protein YckC|nr:RDD family protein [Candidatus Nanopelagicales bacterium]MCU0297132.1 RDD family protein [Candidatus Nanopelagicales bacterium]
MPAGASTAGPTGKYASWFSRVLAYIIDVIPLALLNGIGYLVAAPSTKTVTTEAGIQITTTTGLGVGFWLFWALGIIYWIYNKGYREGTTTQSIGKKVMGMHTVGEHTGQPIGFGTAFGRLILLYIDFAICYIGVLWPLWDKNNQCLLSDKITKAVVYKD